MEKKICGNDKKDETMVKEIVGYWSKRSESFSEGVLKMLYGEKKSEWENLIYSKINKKASLKILDVGCGPGAFSILLGLNPNYEVTGIDACEEMLEQARKNAVALNSKAEFIKSEADEIDFDDESFDIIISRNVTWNLMQPERGYKNWYKLLKKGGMLLNFDANWYHYLYSEEARKKKEEMDKLNLTDPDPSHKSLSEEMKKKMEDLARNMPLSRENRPFWDFKALADTGFKMIDFNLDIGNMIYTEMERKRYSATPMFMIAATKVEE